MFAAAKPILPLCFALAMAMAGPALAVDTSMQIVLELKGNAERNVLTYTCEGAEPFDVEYVNAQPIFLAFVPVAGEKLIFVNVLSASGAKYASGQYEWWTKGSEATLTDLTAAEGTKPLTCLENSETP
jgi:membrane-bound inhibitor of C-type lysozyme